MLKGLQNRETRVLDARIALRHFLGTPGGRNEQRDAAGEAPRDAPSPRSSRQPAPGQDVSTGAHHRPREGRRRTGDPGAPRARRRCLRGRHGAGVGVLALGMIGATRRARCVHSSPGSPRTTPGARGPAASPSWLSASSGDPRRHSRSSCAVRRRRESSLEVPACAILGLGLLGDELVVPDLVRGARQRLRGRRTARHPSGPRGGPRWP